MGKEALIDVWIGLDGTDFSGVLNEVSANNDFDELESTTFANAADSRSRDYDAGLVKATFQIGVMQNYAAGGASTVIAAAAGTKVTVVVKPTDAAASATNPWFSFTCLISKDVPIGGQVGQMAKKSLTWPICGKITRIVS